MNPETASPAKEKQKVATERKIATRLSEELIEKTNDNDVIPMFEEIKMFQTLIELPTHFNTASV